MTFDRRRYERLPSGLIVPKRARGLTKRAFLAGLGAAIVTRPAAAMLQVNELNGFNFAGGVTAPPLTNLWGWYMAAEAYTETVGTPTTLITSDGTVIGSLKDMTGNSRHFYQATAGNKPVFKTSQFGSYPSVRSASGDYMTTGGAPTFDGSYSIYIVFRTNTWTSNAALVGVDNNTPRFLAGYQAGTTGDYYIGYGATTLAVSFADDVNHIMAATFNPSSTFYLARDGQAPSSTASPGNGGAGTNIVLMAFGSPISPSYDGDIAEVLIYDDYHGNPSSGTGLLVRQYLNQKYGLGFAL